MAAVGSVGFGRFGGFIVLVLLLLLVLGLDRLRQDVNAEGNVSEFKYRDEGLPEDLVGEG